MITPLLLFQLLIWITIGGHVMVAVPGGGPLHWIADLGLFSTGVSVGTSPLLLFKCIIWITIGGPCHPSCPGGGDCALNKAPIFTQCTGLFLTLKKPAEGLTRTLSWRCDRNVALYESFLTVVRLWKLFIFYFGKKISAVTRKISSLKFLDSLKHWNDCTYMLALE